MTKRAIPWGAKVRPELLASVQGMVKALAWRPEQDGHVLTAFAFETAETFDPAIRNKAGSGAAGLIQWTTVAAVEQGLTVDQIAQLSDLEQVELARRYFERRHPERIHTLDDLYMAILWPVAVGQAPDYVLAMNPRQYRLNSGLDVNRDGKITKNEAAALVRRKMEKGLRPGYVLYVDDEGSASVADAAFKRLGAALKDAVLAWEDLARVITDSEGTI